MNFRKLLGIHAVITFAAGIVLIVTPGIIPATVGITLDPAAYLVCYLLAASELSVAVLSFLGRTLKDQKSLRVIATTCIVMHAASGLLEGYALTQGLNTAIWGNIALRILVVILFFYYGIYKTAHRNTYIRRH